MHGVKELVDLQEDRRRRDHDEEIRTGQIGLVGCEEEAVDVPQAPDAGNCSEPAVEGVLVENESLLDRLVRLLPDEQIHRASAKEL